MKNKVLIYSDFDSKSGLGHLSRAQTFFDALDHDLFEINLSSEVNPKSFGVKFGFLEKSIWKPLREATTEKYSLVFVDTYDPNIIRQLKNWEIDKKILLLDSNFSQALPHWPDLVIDLERTTPRHLETSKKYIHGIALIGSAIQRLKRGNSINCSKRMFPSKVVVNFGGSNRALNYLMKLNSIIETRIDIQFVVFCSNDIYLDLESVISPHENATVKCIGDDYFAEMINCDLLVTSSGSSFLEAIYMKMPTAVFNLFENASLNFEAFQMSSNVIYAGRIEDLDRDWFADISLNYQKNKTGIDKNSFEEQFHFIDIDTLKRSIGPILQKSAARH
jgi:hypothetical protein